MGGVLARDARRGGVFGIIFGILVIAIAFLPDPAGTVEERLANFDVRYATWQGVVGGLLALFTLLFAVYLRTVLGVRSYSTTTAAAALLVLGIFIVAAIQIYNLSATATLAGIYNDPASGAADRDTAVLMATVLLANQAPLLGFFVGIPIGFVLFSLAMWNSKTFPNWLADVGIAFVVLFAAFLGASSFVDLGAVGSVLFPATIILALIWIFASSGYLLQSARKVVVGEPAPA